MPSSVASGAIYGTGVYGTSLYNVANITVLVDGVVGTTALNDTLQIQGDASHVVCSLCLGALNGSVGSVSVQAEAIVVPTGVSATGSLGTLVQITVNRIPVTGVEGTGQIGTAGLETNNYIDVTGFEVSSFVNDALSITGEAVTVLPGVAITSTLNNTLNIIENEVVVPPSASAIIALGTVTINTTSFDFNSVASLYSRIRTVHIPRQTTSKERTVIVPAD